MSKMSVVEQRNKKYAPQHAKMISHKNTPPNNYKTYEMKGNICPSSKTELNTTPSKYMELYGV